MIGSGDMSLLWRLALAGLSLTSCVWGQDTSEQRPLGDVVRRQQEQRRHSKPAKKVVSDDDILTNHLHSVTGWVATTIIIPGIRITGMVPDSVSMLYSEQAMQKIFVAFGPNGMAPNTCATSIECAEDEFMRQFQHGGTIGSNSRILFDSDDSIQGNSARIAHFEVVQDVRGKMRGTVALIQFPQTVGYASCMYKMKDAPEVESWCDTFISSLQVELPQHYIYVEHHY